MFGSEGNEHKAQGANWQKSILFRCLKSEKISHPKIRKIEIIFPFLWEPLATNRPHFQFFVSAATCERAFTTAFKSHISCKKDLFDANGKSIKNPITVAWVNSLSLKWKKNIFMHIPHNYCTVYTKKSLTRDAGLHQRTFPWTLNTFLLLSAKTSTFGPWRCSELHPRHKVQNNWKQCRFDEKLLKLDYTLTY